ncbi:hypothetical protein H9X60_22220 (plasmid) [Providencia rettgeri]|nr:hypothetical protein H9X60_22220 [Providencia rettgeri]
MNMITKVIGKGNFSYYLNFYEDTKLYKFDVYVKIRSKKKKEALGKTRALILTITSISIEEIALKLNSLQHLQKLHELNEQVLNERNITRSN